jgi:hypothetical protein
MRFTPSGYPEQFTKAIRHAAKSEEKVQSIKNKG